MRGLFVLFVGCVLSLLGIVRVITAGSVCAHFTLMFIPETGAVIVEGFCALSVLSLTRKGSRLFMNAASAK